MFNSYSYNHTHVDTYHRVNVTEKRAPTDESVRLLHEMEKAARDKMIASISVNDNKFNCVIHRMFDWSSARHKFLVIFELNGEKHTVDCVVDDVRDPHKVADQLVEEVSRKISAVILRHPFNEMMSEMIRSGSNRY